MAPLVLSTEEGVSATVGYTDKSEWFNSSPAIGLRYLLDGGSNGSKLSEVELTSDDELYVEDVPEFVGLQEPAARRPAWERDPLLEKIESSVIGSGIPLATPYGEKTLIYADFTASGRSLSFIEDTIRRQIMPYYSNTHTTASHTGRQTTGFREEAREIIADSVNANKQQDAVIFCGAGVTGAILKFVNMLTNTVNWQRAARTAKGPLVVIGPYEHHSNILPWRESGAKVIQIRQNSKGQVDFEHLSEVLHKHKDHPVKVGSFSAASNVTGILTDVDPIARILHTHKALACFDYASAGPYVQINMNPSAEDAYKDAVFISPHKFVGGPSTPGLLILKKACVGFAATDPTRKPPCGPGGGTVMMVSDRDHRYLDDIQQREEGGTPEIIGAVRTGLVFQLKEEVGSAKIMEREHRLWHEVLTRWSACKNIKILGDTSVERLSIVSFVVLHGDQALHHSFVASLLSDLFGIQARAGCSCAGPYAQQLFGVDDVTMKEYESALMQGDEGVKPGFVRVNFNFFNSEVTTSFIIEAVEFIATHGWKFLVDYNFNAKTGEWTHKSRGQSQYQTSLRSVKFSELARTCPGKIESGVLSAPQAHDYLQQAWRLATQKQNQNKDAQCSVHCPSARPDNSRFLEAFDSPEANELRWFPLPQEAAQMLCLGQAPIRQGDPNTNPFVKNTGMHANEPGPLVCPFEVWLAKTERDLREGVPLPYEEILDQAKSSWRSLPKHERQQVKAAISKAHEFCRPLDSSHWVLYRSKVERCRRNLVSKIWPSSGWPRCDCIPRRLWTPVVHSQVAQQHGLP